MDFGEALEMLRTSRSLAEMDEFAADFQRFVGVDLQTIPEEYREHFAERGVIRCKARAPCFVRGAGSLCECLQRISKWQRFWRIVKLDLDGVDFPQNLAVGGQTTPNVGPFHRPIFTFVCPGCGKREDSYHMTHPGQMVGAGPALPRDVQWICVTSPAKPIDVIEGAARNTVVCSDACAKTMFQQWVDDIS